MANQSLMYKWPNPPKEEEDKFPKSWVSMCDEKPYANSRVIVYSQSLGVVVGFAKIARSGRSWRTEYVCIRKSDSPNSQIIRDVIKWCYCPKP